MLDAGRSKLYSALKTLRARWETVAPQWHDAMRQQFAEQTWTPLEDQASAALEAIDQMAVVLNQMQRECTGDAVDIFAAD
jgi:acyl transferase domain-containing protein